MIDEKPSLEAVYFAHHGIKGMHWGVRNEDPKIGRKREKPLTLTDKTALKAAGLSQSDLPRLKAKYGPGSLDGDESKGGLSSKQKKIIAGVAIGVGVGVIAYGLHRYGGTKASSLPSFDDYTPPQKSRFQLAMADYEKASLKNWRGYSPEAVAGLSTERVTLPKGSILKRLSTERETSIHPSGFYAAFEDSDVERYKAILPTVWNRSYRGDGSGFVVNLKSNADIKAPSPRETLDMFKGILNDDVPMPHLPGSPMGKVRTLFGATPHGMSDDEFAAKHLPMFAAGWIAPDTPAVSHFFSKVKGQGFNALVDLNDAGALSKTPLRVIDGSLFSVSGHETLTRDAIKLAQENIQSLAHAIMAHFGVKGMHWGQRKQQALGKLRSYNTTKNKAIVISGATVTASILHRTGHLKPLASGGGRLILKGTGFVAEATLNTAITVIGTPIHTLMTLTGL